jgi:hypothetical protein
MAVVPTVNFLLGRQAKGGERRNKRRKIQLRFRGKFIFLSFHPMIIP